MSEKLKVKKPTYKQLAKYLNVSEQAVKQYPKIKRDLMILGLLKMKEDNDLLCWHSAEEPRNRKQS